MDLDFAVVGQRLKRARLDKKLTQEYVAGKMGVSVAFLSRIESGLTHINLKRLSQLCAILDVNEGYILTGAASHSEHYLTSEFNNIFKNCSANKQKLIYKVAKIIAES